MDLNEIPISALRDRTRQMLETALNELRVLPTDEDNIPRDWRGLAHFAGVNISSLTQSKNPTADLLKLWDEEKILNGQKRPSLQELLDNLGHIDRWDVYDDLQEPIMKDSEHYSKPSEVQPFPGDGVQTFENGCLTKGDRENFSRGLPFMKYDAFLLYANEDFHHAKQMITILESQYNFNLLVKDRDLLGGVVEFSAITKLIAKRCSSVIVILSPNLLKSEENKFFLAFAQAISIQQSKRIIPCKYEPCDLPDEFLHLYYLDYQRALLFNNFWQRLSDSVRACIDTPRLPSAPTCLNPPLPRCTITEMKSEEVQIDSVANVTEETRIIRMSDPSTHFPGNSLADPSVAKWSASDLSNSTECEISCDSLKDNGEGLISRLKKIKKKKGWFKKKKAVALEV